MDAPGLDDAGANRSRWLGAFRAAQVLVLHGGGLDMEVDAVEQRAGDAVAVILDLTGRAAALALRVSIVTAFVRIPFSVT